MNKGLRLFASIAIAVLLVSGFVYLFMYLEEHKISLFSNTSKQPVKSYESIKWDDAELFDSTIYNGGANTCNGERYGMSITISPCIAQDPDGRDIEQEVIFDWDGASQKNITWIFVYNNELRDGRINALVNHSKTFTQDVTRNQWVNNYVVDGIVSYENYTSTPSYCDLGNLNNTQFHNVTRNKNGTAYNQNICFTSRTIVNATAFRISGNADITSEEQVTKYVEEYVDVTDRVQYLGKGLLNDNRSYYRIQDVTFNPGQEIKTQWIYTPKDASKSGKWHILGFESEVGLVQSVVQDKYIYIDPWWDNSWTKRKPIYINTTLVLVNASVLINVTFDDDMKADFGDLRFINGSESTELGYWFYNNSYVSSNSVLVWVNLSGTVPAGTLSPSTNATIYMYYGNPGATTTSNIKNAFLFADDFNDASVDWTNTWQSATQSCYNIYETGKLNATNCANKIISKKTFGNGYEVVARAASTNVAGAPGMYLHSATSTTYQVVNTYTGLASGFTGIEPRLTGGGVSANNYYILRYFTNASGQDNITFSSENLYYSKGDLLNVAGNGSTRAGTIGVYQYSAGNAVLDWIFVRNAISIEPTATFGDEETSSGLAVTLSYPAASAVVNTTSPRLNASIIPTGLNLSNATASVWDSGNTLVFNELQALSGNETIVANWSASLAGDGSYTWNVNACGFTGLTTTCTTSANRTFTVDTTAPTLAVNSPVNNSYNIAQTSPYNVSLSVNSSDARLQACWYSTNNNLTNATYTCNSSVNVPFTTSGSKLIYIYANDTVGNTASNSVAVNYVAVINNQTYNTAVLAGTINPFTINFSYDSTAYPTVIAVLHYNNTEYSGTESSTGVYTTSVVAPVAAGVNNYTFYWTLGFNDGSTTRYYNSTFHNQTVSPINVDDCSSYTNVIYNFTLADEDTRSSITPNSDTMNMTIEVSIDFSNLGGTTSLLSFNKSYEDLNPVAVCLESALGDSSFKIDGAVKYLTDTRATEYYYIQNQTISSSNTPQNITLYDLLSSRAQEFLITYKDSDYLPVEGAIIEITRKYLPLGSYLIVEVPKTDKDGRTIGNFVLNTEIYTIIVKKNGVILGTWENMRAFCSETTTGNCRINLNAAGSSSSIGSFRTQEGVTYSTTYNQTSRAFRMLFSVASGASKTMALNITLYDNYLNTSVCTNSIAAPSGTISCTIGQSYGNNTFLVQGTADGVLLFSNTIRTSTEESNLSPMRYILAAIIIIVLPLMALGSGVATVFLFIIGFVAAIFMLGMDASNEGIMFGLGWVLVGGIILVVKMVQWARKNGGAE